MAHTASRATKRPIVTTRDTARIVPSFSTSCNGFRLFRSSYLWSGRFKVSPGTPPKSVKMALYIKVMARDARGHGCKRKSWLCAGFDQGNDSAGPDSGTKPGEEAALARRNFMSFSTRKRHFIGMPPRWRKNSASIGILIYGEWRPKLPRGCEVKPTQNNDWFFEWRDDPFMNNGLYNFDFVRLYTLFIYWEMRTLSTWQKRTKCDEFW